MRHTLSCMRRRSCWIGWIVTLLPSSRAFSSKLRLNAVQAPRSTLSMSTLQFCDIGANLLEDRFTAGTYRGTFRHEPDLDCIMQRAVTTGVSRIILTAGTVQESREAVQAARTWRTQYPDIQFYSTVGVHPTRCKQVFVDGDDGEPEKLLQELLEIARDGMTDGTVVAIGEIGLDYDRLEFCPKDIQQEYLVKQLQSVAKPTGLPLFLHNRSVGQDLYDILIQERDCWKSGGVVHSFDDTLELANLFIDGLGLYIGLNGCSLRTESNLETASKLPLDRVLLETDCPYCEIRKTHSGYAHIRTHFEAKAEKKFERGLAVKSRQEPCHIIQVAEVVAGAKEMDLSAVAETCYANSMTLFGWNKNKILEGS